MMVTITHADEILPCANEIQLLYHLAMSVYHPTLSMTVATENLYLSQASRLLLPTTGTVVSKANTSAAAIHMQPHMNVGWPGQNAAHHHTGQ